MKFVKLLVLAMSFSLLCNVQAEMEYENDLPPKKQLWLAIVSQAVLPGQGNYYIDNNLTKAIIYPTIIAFGGFTCGITSNYPSLSAVSISCFTITIAAWAISYIDLINSYKLYSTEFDEKYKFMMSPNSISFLIKL